MYPTYLGNLHLCLFFGVEVASSTQGEELDPGQLNFKSFRFAQSVLMELWINSLSDQGISSKLERSWLPAVTEKSVTEL